MTARVKVLCGVLALLIVASAATLVWMLRRDEPTYATSSYAKDEGSYTVGSLPDDGKEPVSAAVEGIQHALGYDYRTLEKGLASATALMTDDFAAEFTDTFEQVVRADARDSKAVTVALVKGAGLVRRDGSDAECLVFVDQVVLSSAAEQSAQDVQQVVQARVHVTLKQVDGAWLVDDIEPA